MQTRKRHVCIPVGVVKMEKGEKLTLVELKMRGSPEDCDSCQIRGDWTICPNQDDGCHVCGCYECCYGELPDVAAKTEYARSRGV